MPKTEKEMTAEERLAAIAQAMKAKQVGGNYKKAEPKLACPIDPAERALCEGCQ